ncbi:MAG: hypothetical protein EYC70_01800 [Planctomycetota bacterium]|nr:MAG: hypothetical protein EYC70_01800 [Planctomycetota bacterium]
MSETGSKRGLRALTSRFSHPGKNLVIVMALLAAGFFAAWLRFRPYLGDEAKYTDGEQVYDRAQTDAIRYAVWDDAQPLPAGVNTSSWETRATISPDGRLLVFGVGQPGLNADLYVADYVDGKPVDPRPLRVLNTEFDDLAPAFAPGYLYFASTRPDSLGASDIYRAAYDGGSFAGVENLGPSINTEAAETDPAPVPGGGAFAFASNRSRGARADYDLYLAEPGPVGTGEEGYRVTAFPAVNSPFEECEPWFTGEAYTLLFSSNRGDAADYDLYRSVRDRGVWLPPEPIEGLNSPLSERGPTASPDGFTLWFSSEDTGEDSNLYVVHSKELYRVPGRPVGWLDLVVLASLLLLALLAWLATKWEQLDVLYKCYLISLLIHLLLLWLFQKVLVQSERVPQPERERTIKVRIAPDLMELAAAMERNGELETFRSPGTGSEGPERAEQAPAELAGGEPEQPAVERASAAPAEAPARTDVSLARAERTPASPVEVQTPDAELQRISGSAPELAVAASQSLAETPAQARQTAPNRAALQPAGDHRAAPVARSERAESVPVQGPAFAAAPLGPTRQTTQERSAVAVATPQETVERRSGSSSELALAVPSTQGPLKESVQAPARASSAVAERPAQVPSASLSKAELGPSSLAEAAPTRQPASGAWVTPSETTDARKAPVNVAVPAENVQRMEGGVGELELAAAPALSPAGRRLDQPGRASTRVEDVPVSGPVSRTERAANQDAAAAVGGGPARSAITAEPTAALNLPSVPVQQDAVDSAPPAVAEAQASPAEEVLAPLVAFGPRNSVSEQASQPQRVDVETTFSEPAFETPSFDSSNLQPTPVAAMAESTPGRPAAAEFAPVRQDLPAVALDAPAELPGGTPGSTSVSSDSPSELDLVASDVSGNPTLRRTQDPAAAPSRWQHEPAAEEPPSLLPLASMTAQEPAPEGAPEPGRLEHTPYRSRFGSEKDVAIRTFGGSAETERAVASGLAYLAKRQSRQGNWWSRTGNDEKYGSVTVGRTGLCMLAFLGAGHTHDSDTQYSANVQRAIDFLLSVQDPVTGHFGYTEAYSHGIATYALGECYALTEDPKLRESLAKAVAHIVSRQTRGDDPRKRGGWSYYYPDDRVFDSWPRASITAWQVMALESARLGGLEVPDETFRLAHDFLLTCQDQEKGLFLYSHDPLRLRSVYPWLPGSTPAALFALSLLGEDANSPRFEDVRQFILARAPRSYSFTTEEDFVQRCQGNDYFWYYATLAMFRCGGDVWERWNKAMKATILPAQQDDGSWLPISIYANVAGDTDWDRSYSTAMCVLTMEVYYRYFTPLLRVE